MRLRKFAIARRENTEATYDELGVRVTGSYHA